ncbi:MAG: hypothetical protein V7707_09705 [Motiliproteus sp.]
MKVLMMGLFAVLLTGCQSTGSSPAPEGYRYVQGKEWRGVTVGDSAVRQSSVVCFEYQCYRLGVPVNLPSDLKQRYQIRDIGFESLAQAPGVARAEDTLQLPDDLGHYLFVEARRRHMVEMSSDGNVWIP